MKTEKRMICFIVSAALLILMLYFTSCGAATAEAEVERKPCYHVTVYSPEIEKAGYAGRRKQKYTITVEDFSELLPKSYACREQYHLLRIPLEDGRFELVSTSLVEIEYY
jgi:hypothetical protein